MAKSATKRLYTAFVKGLITEAGPLTFPEGAALDIDNMVLNRDGSMQRRLGMDYDSSSSLSPVIPNADFDNGAVTVIPWINANGNADNKFVLVQVGPKIYIHSMGESTPSTVVYTVDLDAHKIPAVVGSAGLPVSGAAGKGYMFIVSKDIEPFYLTYDGTTFTETEIVIKTRDFIGAIDDLLGDAGQDTLLSIWHLYNLRNQGWNSPDMITYATDGVNNPTPNNYFPSNAQTWSEAKNSTDDFDVTKLIKLGVIIINFGNTRSPSGHYILDEFNKDRDLASGGVGIEKDTYLWRPSSVSFYAGRVFYAGVDADAVPRINPALKPPPSISGNIYFSPILLDVEKAGQCYQAADPTSEAVSDLVDTDGGVIVIPNSGKILKMIEMQEYLVIITENGVWSIRGGNETGFVATGYRVEKVSSIRAVSPKSVTQVDTGIVMWAESGIYAVTYNPQTVKIDVSNLTEKTIQTEYDSISPVAKLFATGVYDQISRRIRWLYNSNPTFDGATRVNEYDKELILDTVLGAFYTNTIQDLVTDSPKIIGFYNPPGLSNTTADVNIVAGGVDVVAAGAQLVVTVILPTNGDAGVKYVFSIPGVSSSQYTFGRYLNRGFVDWQEQNSIGIDFPAFLSTGHEIVGDPSVVKQAPTLLTILKRTETQYVDDGLGNVVFDFPSDCTVQARWEWSTATGSGGRWSTPMSVYRLLQLPGASGTLPETIDFGYDLVVNKNPLRGHGRALSLYFSSSPGKDMNIIGWTIDLTGATKT